MNLLAAQAESLPITETAAAVLLVSLLITALWWASLYR